ncbi:DUF5753 domain-containing protein [Actinomadura luteofluorescens]|uniref:DUF5753 domain-containing protein n=1 Tax=Actinomadura luteofluorescens TaxID=46163 RepID=UPI00363289FB
MVRLATGRSRRRHADLLAALGDSSLAQTPAYALALLRGNQEAADARIGRQAILTEGKDSSPPTVVLLLNEHVLHNPVGTPETMREQLEHLLEMSLLPNVTIQVVLSSGEHEGVLGAFVVATMEDRSEVAYIETAIRGITTDNPSDLSSLARTLVELRSQALTHAMSRELIRKVIKERWT